jgi:hypothetical protein
MANVLLAYDCTLKKVGCVLLQAAMGGSSDAANRFDVSTWLVAPTTDLRVYSLPEEKFAQHHKDAQLDVAVHDAQYKYDDQTQAGVAYGELSPKPVFVGSKVFHILDAEISSALPRLGIAAKNR